MALKVNEQSDAVKTMALEWAVLEALNGGTPAMRVAGKDHLPQWPSEESSSYAARLRTATLFPAYKRTVVVMAAKPFSKELTLSDDTPGQIKSLAEDIDLQGVSLHNFAAEMFVETLGFGLAGVLVDYPDTRAKDDKGQPKPGPQRTVAQVEAEGLRPYFVRVRHDQILGWRTALVGGKLRLTQLRLSESREADDGDFGSDSIPQVRVLTPGAWALWEEVSTDKGKEWQQVDAGSTSLDYVPFVPFYGRRDAFMIGAAPLLDLAYLNVKHWQSQSDQDTILHAARVPILAMFGADEKTSLVIGGSAAVSFSTADADLKWVEHSGAAIGAGKESLADLQEQMIETGAELLIKRPGKRTATESAGDQEANKSDLQRAAETFEDSLDKALQIVADYIKAPTGGTVSLFKDYGATSLSDASASLVKDLQMAGLLSKETTLRELQRRGVLSADLDLADELAAATADGPPPGSMGTDAQGNPLPLTPSPKVTNIKKNPDGSMTATQG